MMNAVPQLQWQNNGVWKKIEQSCNAWANKYERVWVVCGPVFFGKEPAMWLGQDGEQKIAIPDALFKIVIRKDGDTLKTLAFIIPNIVPKAKKDPKLFLTSIDDVEKKTGLDFLTKHQGISAEAIEEIEKMKAEEVDW
jgi:DNA/RNA endonuclease G (NUC1)